MAVNVKFLLAGPELLFLWRKLFIEAPGLFLIKLISPAFPVVPLPAIDGRSRVHQGQALQKEKPLKHKHFLRIRCFRALYFSASCALDF